MKSKLTSIILFMIIVTLAIPLIAFAAEYYDVSDSDSYYSAVEALTEMGVLNGRGDGTFDPNGNMTRAEFCAMLARSNGYTESNASTPFVDIKGHWAADYISFCYDKGYVNGMTKTEFLPNNYVTCEQAIKMIVCAANLGDESLSKIGPKWYSGYTMIAKKNKLLYGTEEAYYGMTDAKITDGEIMNIPIGKPSTRSYVAQLTYNALCGLDAKKDTSDKDNTIIADEDVWEPGAAEVDDLKSSYENAGTVKDGKTEIAEDKNNTSPSETDTTDKKPEAPPANNKNDKTDKIDKDDIVIKDDDKDEEDLVEEEHKPIKNTTTASSNGKIIVIDPGHNYSKINTGAIGNGLKEQNITFYIADKLKPMLERNGFTVIMTRNYLKENVSVKSNLDSLKRRVEIANDAGADLFVSIHCNAGGGTGTETFHFTGSTEGKKLASCIQEGAIDAVGLRNRGVKSANFYVIKHTDMPAALIETAFIDTRADAEYLASDKYREAFAEGIARGICEYVGIKFK